ncbi:MAG: hypothetical protein AB7P21_27830 [Lautropia sp.]
MRLKVSSGDVDASDGSPALPHALTDRVDAGRFVAADASTHAGPSIDPATDATPLTFVDLFVALQAASTTDRVGMSVGDQPAAQAPLAAADLTGGPAPTPPPMDPGVWNPAGGSAGVTALLAPIEDPLHRGVDSA